MKKTKQIKIRDVLVGGGAPIAVQSMTNTDTRDAKATLAQIRALADAGCDIVRCAVPDMQAAEALRAMGLPAEAFAKRPEALSGGMRRRVALARMVCFGGDVWLMDEAFKGLDTDSKHQVMDALVRYAEGRLIVMVTHDEQDARYMDAHIIRLTGPPLTVQRA